jgi:MoaA/NifB/PqqE/SkfB family radical SAM enzyme
VERVPAGPDRAGALLPALTARQAEDVLEAHHFRRVVIQREILRRRGADHVAVLGLGQLYLQLRQRLGDLGLPRRKARRSPANVNAGQGFAFVSHLGTVHPSGFLPLAAGSVRTGRLAGIYRTSPLFTGLREHGRPDGRCGACEFAPVCGGSRSRAFALSDDPYAEDPWCS